MEIEPIILRACEYCESVSRCLRELADHYDSACALKENRIDEMYARFHVIGSEGDGVFVG